MKLKYTTEASHGVQGTGETSQNTHKACLRQADLCHQAADDTNGASHISLLDCYEAELAAWLLHATHSHSCLL